MRVSQISLNIYNVKALLSKIIRDLVKGHKQ